MNYVNQRYHFAYKGLFRHSYDEAVQLRKKPMPKIFELDILRKSEKEKLRA